MDLGKSIESSLLVKKSTSLTKGVVYPHRGGLITEKVYYRLAKFSVCGDAICRALKVKNEVR